MNIALCTDEKFSYPCGVCVTSILENNKNEEFRNKYRNIDVLLLDDAQFLEGREGTQNEIFETLLK